MTVTDGNSIIRINLTGNVDSFNSVKGHNFCSTNPYSDIGEKTKQGHECIH